MIAVRRGGMVVQEERIVFVVGRVASVQFHGEGFRSVQIVTACGHIFVFKVQLLPRAHQVVILLNAGIH